MNAVELLTQIVCAIGPDCVGTFGPKVCKGRSTRAAWPKADAHSTSSATETSNPRQVDRGKSRSK
jgi:hypothetical protein